MKDAKPKFVEATEHSIIYRWLGVIMQAICVAASCSFVETDIYLTMFYVWFGIIGNYLSYRYRNSKPRWLDPAVYIGCLAVAAYCVQDLIADYEMGEYALMRPIVHLLAGILVMHSFELKDRSDIYANLVLGLLVLCVSAPAGRSVLFGAGVFTFITLGGVMFYLDARSRNAIVADGSYTTLEEFSPNKGAPSRSGLPGTIFSIALLPLLSTFIFMFVPRGDAYVDKLAAKLGSQFSAAQKNDPRQLPGVSKDPIIKKLDQRAPHSQTELQLPQHRSESKFPPEKPKEMASGDDGKKHEGEPGKGADEKPNRANYKEEAIYPKEKGKMPASKAPQPNAKSKTGEGAAKPGQSTEAVKPAAPRKGVKAGKAAKPAKPVKAPKPGRPGESAKDARATKASSTLEKKTIAAKKSTDSQPKPISAPKPKPKVKPDYDSAANTGKSNGFSDKPMLLVDEQFDDQDDRLVMTVSCPRTAYVKRMYYDTFDGRMWSSADEGQLRILARTDQGFSTCADLSQFTLPPGIEVIQTDQVYTVGQDFGKFLSFIGMPQKIDLGPLAAFAAPSGALACDNFLPPSYRYSIRAIMPLWNLDLLRKEPKETEEIKSRVKANLSNCLELPVEDPMVPALAAEVAGDGSWFSQAENLVAFLRTHYKYDVNKKYGGAIDNYADEFLLRTRTGDCKEFASAFVVLCRCQGIPARCVSGFTPGTQNLISGQREIRRKNAHVWCQVYIPSCAWIDFDPVPDGNLPAKRAESNYSAQTLAKQVYGDNAISPTKILAMIGVALASGLAIYYSIIALRGLKNRKPKEKFDALRGAPSRGTYKKVMKALQKVDFVKAPHETYHEFIARVSKTQYDQALGGKPIYPELTPRLEKFLALYSEGFFGKKESSSEIDKAGESIVQHLKSSKLSKRR